jgi:CDP-glucose 4,6-dehydratase
MVTSDKAYRNEEWVWAYRETDRLGGRDPYSCSKACAELVVDSYRDSFFFPEKYSSHGVALASARAGNVIGGGDWAVDRLIPDIMRAFKDGKPVLIRSPHATRPWQFVLEALSGYLLLAEKLYDEGPQFSGGWNFGPDVDDVQPVSWITNYLTEQWGDDASWAADEGEHPHEASLLMLDCTKAKRLLGWAPRLRLPTTLDWIIEWNRSYNAGGNVRHSLETQIYRYEELP